VAILVAVAAGVLVLHGTRPPQVTGADVMARNVASRLATVWDEPEATRAYVGEVRDVTGFEAKLVRDPRRLPPRVHAAAARGLAIVPENPQHIFIPVVRGGGLAGALEMEKFGPRPTPWPWWPLVVTLGLVVAALSLMAGRVASQLARPLEQLAHAADRIGGGDLAFRTDVAKRRRWVAAEVQDVGVAFNRMAGRVEAMVRGQRELLGAISHELRSPLGRARVALEIARDRLPPPPAPGEDGGARDGREGRSPGDALDDVERQLGAVDGILGDLLDVTRAGLADLRREPRAFVPWLREKAADEAGAVVAVGSSPEAEPLVFAFDAALLGRAVHNLLVNARAHGHPAGQPIELRVSREAQLVRVIVRDHGPGFAPGFAERAFEPFVRADAARARPTAGAGYGLGLTIVKRVVEAHGGHVFARNAAAGTGAEVGFELPVG